MALVSNIGSTGNENQGTNVQNYFTQLLEENKKNCQDKSNAIGPAVFRMRIFSLGIGLSDL